MTNPIIPGTKRDRTGSVKIIDRALAEIKRRFDGLEADVLALFDGIPAYALNLDEIPVVYGLTPEQMRKLSEELQASLERWIAGSRNPEYVFWWDTYVSEAQQLGSAQTAANLANLSEAYAAVRTIESIVFSPTYQTRLAMAQIKSYEHWTGLASAQRAELAQIIGRAVVDGKNPKAVRTEIMERLDVTRAKAAQYAQTDITDTLRQARIAEAEYAETSLGIKTGLLWTSALLPTTRRTHAIRNGETYSRDEVKAFYARDGNRYNCHCATTEALLDADGKPILTDRLKASMASELKTWESSQK
jgi:uncharacterized protein with gpF-like domain